MERRVRIWPLTPAAAAALLASSAICLAQQPSEIGTLDCVVEGQTGLLIGAHEGLSCTFVPASGEPNDAYIGVIREIAPDIDMSGQMVLRWTVLAATPGAYASGRLEGEYLRASTGASETGVDGEALVGGVQNTFHLQPAGVPAEQGLNVAPGITSFQLRAVRA
jgi:hypothetical protein